MTNEYYNNEAYTLEYGDIAQDTDVEGKFDEVKAGFDLLPAGLAATTAEIIVARGGSSDLGTRLDLLSGTVAANYPDMTGNSGKYLTNNGTDASWAKVNPRIGVETSTGAIDVALDSDSKKFQQITITAKDKFVTLPDATGLEEENFSFIIENTGNLRFGIKDSDGTFLGSVDVAETAYFHLIDNSISAGTWKVDGGADLIMNRLKVVLNADTANTNLCAVKLTSTTVLVVYAGADSDGFCMLLTWSGSAIVLTDTLEFDTDNATYLSVCRVSDTQAVICYTGTDSDGFAVSITNTAGTLSAGTPFEWGTTDVLQKACVTIHATKIGVIYRDAADDLKAQVLTLTGETITSDTAVTNIVTGTMSNVDACLVTGAVDSALIAVAYSNNGTNYITDVQWDGTTITTTDILNFSLCSTPTPVVRISDSFVVTFNRINSAASYDIYANLIYWDGSTWEQYRQILLYSSSISDSLYPSTAYLIDSEHIGFAYRTGTLGCPHLVKIKVVAAATANECVLKVVSDIQLGAIGGGNFAFVGFDAANAIWIAGNSLENSGYLTAEKIEVA